MHQNCNDKNFEELIKVLHFYLHELTHVNCTLRMSCDRLFESYDTESSEKERCFTDINSYLKDFSDLTMEMRTCLGLYDEVKTITKEELNIDNRFIESLYKVFTYDKLLNDKKIIFHNRISDNDKIVKITNKELFEIVFKNTIKYAYNHSYFETNFCIEIEEKPKGKCCFRIIYYGDFGNTTSDVININNLNPINDTRMFISKRIAELLGIELAYYNEKISDYHISCLNKIIDTKNETIIPKELIVKLKKEFEKLKSENTLSLIINSNESCCDVTFTQVLYEICNPTFKNILEVII